MRDRSSFILTSFILLFILGLSLFFVYGRYRLPLLVPLSILAAVTICRAYECLKQQRLKLLFALCLLTGLFTWFLHGPVLPANMEVSFFPDYYNQGNKYWNLGKYDLALAEYERALSVRPGEHPGAERLFNALTSVYLKNGQLGRAEALLQRAAARYPENKEFQQQLHRVRVLKQDPKSRPKAIAPQNPSQ